MTVIPFPPRERRKAYSLIRFSTPQQALGDSKRRQLEQTAAYCAAQNLELAELIVDEGLSGYHGVHRRRGALGRFVKRFEAGEIPPGGVFIAEAFDRLTREPPRIAQQLFLTLINGEMDVHMLIIGKTFTAASIDENVGELYMAIGMMVGAHAESANKSNRIRDQWKKRHTDQTNNAPAWFIKLANGLSVTHFKGLPRGTVMELQIDPAKAAIIKRIFQMATIMGVDLIAKTLNDENVPPLSNRKRPRGVAVWDGTPLRNLIRGRQVLGEQPTSRYIDNKQHPTGEFINAYRPVVSEDEWHAANAALNSRKKGVATGRNVTQYANLFGDLAVCSDCGGRMKILRKGAGGTYRYLGCSNAGVGKCAHCKYHRLDKVERDIMDVFGRLILKNGPRTDPSSSLITQITKAKSDAAQIEAAYERSMLRSGDLAEKTQIKLESDHREKLAQIVKLERELTAIKSAKPINDQIKAMRRLTSSMMDGLSDRDRVAARAKIAATLPSIIQKIVFKPDGSVAVKYNGVIG